MDRRTSDPDVSTGSYDFMVKTQRLHEFADELDGQAQALASHKSALDDIRPATHEWALLGDFPEAVSLSEIHKNALARVTNLVEQLEGIVRFADQVSLDVVRRYESGDTGAGESYRVFTRQVPERIARLL